MAFARLAPVDQVEHGAAQGLGAADLGIAGHLGDGGGDELHRRVRFRGPVRDEEGARAGIDEGPREAREGLGVLRRARGGVAGRQDHPVGVELERGDLGGGKVAVVVRAGLVRRQVRPTLRSRRLERLELARDGVAEDPCCAAG
jgi:hypothetical protein